MAVKIWISILDNIQRVMDDHNPIYITLTWFSPKNYNSAQFEQNEIKSSKVHPKNYQKPAFHDYNIY